MSIRGWRVLAPVAEIMSTLGWGVVVVVVDVLLLLLLCLSHRPWLQRPFHAGRAPKSSTSVRALLSISESN